MAVEYLGILYGLDDVSLQRIQIKQPNCIISIMLIHTSNMTKATLINVHVDEQAEAWVGLMREADDGDGSLSYEEFAAMIKKAQKKN